MARPIFATPNYADETSTYAPTFSGGNWTAGLPLTNLQDRQLSKVARSSGDANADTKFEVDLKVVRGDIRVFALPAHNLSRAARVRIRGSNSAGSFGTPIYDSGWLDVYAPIYPPQTLPWGHPALWDGKITTEDLADLPFEFGFVHVTDEPQQARYWLVEIDDTANPDTYIELGRLWIAPAWQPSNYVAAGAKLGVTTSTQRQEMDGGASIFNEKPTRREFTFTVANLEADEAFSFAFDLQRRGGTSRQLFFVFDPDDTYHMHRRAFLAVCKELSPLDHPFSGFNSTPFALIEEL